MAATLTLAEGLAKGLGIVACEDATGLDALGVPVWFSQRQSSQGRHAHSGKGMLPIEAQVGALMEAIEVAAAERAGARFAGESALLGDLVTTFSPALTVADLAPRLSVAMPAERRVAVEVCEDIASGAQMRLPAELVHLGFSGAQDAELVFGMTSNGLASGNSLEEATLHGLLEVLERDAVALDMARPSTVCLAPLTLPEPFATWHARWLTLGVELHLRVLHSVAGVPCVEAELRDHTAKPAPRGLGFGLHPDPLIALSRAVTEAAQSRLYQICHGKGTPPASVRDAGVPPSPAGPELDFGDLRAMACTSVDQALADLAGRLRDEGLPWVMRRRLNQVANGADLGGLYVVRVLVPGCESVVGSRVRVGRRLARRLSGLEGASAGAG